MNKAIALIVILVVATAIIVPIVLLTRKKSKKYVLYNVYNSPTKGVPKNQADSVAQSYGGVVASSADLANIWANSGMYKGLCNWGWVSDQALAVMYMAWPNVQGCGPKVGLNIAPASGAGAVNTGSVWVKVPSGTVISPSSTLWVAGPYAL